MQICVLTGAGISAESGLPTFREPGDGLWANFDPFELATPGAFKTQPQKVHEFYNLRRRMLQEVEPNTAHFALAELERHLEQAGGSLTVITQNVDDLHERAGSTNVLHIHGELMKARCVSCRNIFPWTRDLDTCTPCPSCGATECLRPHIVWFGEMPFFLDDAQDSIANSDLLASIGTSGSVYPAAGLVTWASNHGVSTCEINLTPSENHYVFDERHYGPASITVPKWVDQLINTNKRP